MDKLKTQILLISLILVLLFSVQSVAAATDGDGNLTSESIDLSICDNTGDVSSDKLLNNPDDILTASNELNVLGADEATYSELGREISNGGNTVELQNHYYIYDGSTSTIDINGNNRVIDGRGAVIDMMGSTIQAFYVSGSGVTIKNLTIKNANFNGDGGGAIYFSSSGTVENCNFTDNTASGDGGAVYFWVEGTVENCNFVDNKATDYGDGGAIRFGGSGNVTNCNFADNSASGGGAIFFTSSGTVENCNFTNNSAFGDGGAINMGSGTVSNCNFVDNKATGSNSWGGAVFFIGEGTVTNCNFTGNNATTGSAIYFYWESSTKTIFNSIFLNNRANSEVLEVIKNENNITITFTGNDNLLNAIYSNGEVSFTNVTYWSANGINKTGSSTTPPRSNKEAGQNITVSVVVNDILVLEEVKVTDENGTIVLDIKAGDNYYIGVRHDTDSYYTEAVNATSNNTKFNVNVTSKTSNNRTVNITAKSNIPNEVIKGKLLFILPNSTEISANYGGNGTWWAVHTFDDYGVYEINASYTGLDNVTINNGTVTISKANSTIGAENKTVTYPSDIVLVTSGENCTGINKSSVVIRNPDGTTADANVNVDGFTITISGLGAGNYTVYYNNTVNSDWNGAGNFTGITVLKANSSVSAGDVEVTYGDSIVVVVSSENATGVSYKVIGADGVVKEGSVNVGESITGLDLAAGDYTVNLTTLVNANYTDNSYTSKITVVPANSSVKAEDVEVTYGDSIVVVVKSENATGVSYRVIGDDGVVKEGSVNVGENITGLDLAAGEYTVNLTTMVNANYSSSNFISKITVVPANSSVKAEDVVVTYGDSIVVVVSSENATGVSYRVIGDDGVVKEGSVNVGENITGLDLAAGQYTVNLTTMVNANYSSSNFISKITVVPANSSVKAEDVVVTYGDSLVVVVSSENATGVSYRVIGDDGVVKEGSVNVGENITGLDLAAGQYTVNLTTMVNANYSSSNFISKITVKPANSSVKAEDVVVTYGDSIVVVVSSENATGVSYKVIGKDGIVKEGILNVNENITGLDLAAGQYTVNLTTMVNANYSSSNFISKITVKLANSSVKAEDVVVTYGDSIVVVVSSENATGVSYKIISSEGVVKEGAVNVGENITGLDLAAGEYTVNLTTMVNSNYTSSNYTSKITVKPANSTVKAEDVTVNYGEAISIPVSSENATEISYSIIDANAKAVINGTVKPDEAISVSDLAAGDYTVSLTTVVDENHTSVSNSSQLHVRHVVTIVIAPVTGHAGEVVNFTAQFQYENGDSVNEGTASLTIRYEDKELLAASMYSILSADESSPVSNGKATFTVKLGEPGRYPYVVSYSGSDVEDAQAESTLTILKADTNVSCSNISGKPADKKNVTVTVLDQDNNPVANGTVTLTLNGKTYNSTVENGTVVLSVELPNPGVYNATVAYDGNDYYNSSSSSISVDVEKVNTNAPSVEDVSGMAGEKTDISVKFVDEYGNPVKNGTATLTIDGKTYTAEVINGTATFKDVVIPENDAVADVYYQGNDYYNASSATFSIKVKQNNTDENKTAKHVSSEIVEGNATGNPIAMMLLALFVMVITYRKK